MENVITLDSLRLFMCLLRFFIQAFAGITNPIEFLRLFCSIITLLLGCDSNEKSSKWDEYTHLCLSPWNHLSSHSFHLTFFGWCYTEAFDLFKSLPIMRPTCFDNLLSFLWFYNTIICYQFWSNWYNKRINSTWTFDLAISWTFDWAISKFGIEVYRWKSMAFSFSR